jgi:hypothetical protein
VNHTNAESRRIAGERPPSAGAGTALDDARTPKPTENTSQNDGVGADFVSACL